MPTALITGVNRGLGLELARQYLQRGGRVFGVYRNTSPELDALQSGPGLRLVQADLSSQSGLDRLARAVREISFDLILHNAGLMGTRPMHEAGSGAQGLDDFDRDEWRTVFEINVFSAAELFSRLAQQLVDGGRAVTVSSDMGSIAGNRFGGWYAYRASKSAVNSLMKSISLDLAERGIISVALHPGWVKTDMGGAQAELTPQQSVHGMLNVIEGLSADQNGLLLAWNGEVLPY